MLCQRITIKIPINIALQMCFSNLIFTIALFITSVFVQYPVCIQVQHTVLLIM